MAMTGQRKVLVLGLLVLGACLVVATALAYRAVIERREGDPRGTLIAAATVGVSFFVSTVCLLAWDDRRRRTPGPDKSGDSRL